MIIFFIVVGIICAAALVILHERQLSLENRRRQIALAEKYRQEVLGKKGPGVLHPQVQEVEIQLQRLIQSQLAQQQRLANNNDLVVYKGGKQVKAHRENGRLKIDE